MTLERSASTLAATLFFVLLLSVLRIADLPLAGGGVLLALVALAAWRPDAGLIVVAAALPVSSVFGRMWTSSGLMWPNALMAAFACGFFLHDAATRSEKASLNAEPGTRLRHPPDRSLRAASLTMAAVVVASLVVQLAAFFERVGWDAFRRDIWYLATRDFFLINRSLPAVSTAALLLEGLVLFYASARLTGISPRLRRAAPRALAAGAVMAAGLNVWRLFEAASRSDTALATTFRLLSTVRINEHYADMNAAGSYFVLVLFVAIALAFDRRGRAWMLAAAGIAAALWMTGSRTAVLAGLVAAALPLLLRQRRIGARAIVVAAAIVVALAVAGATIAVVMPERGNQSSPATAMQVRVELTRTALRMFAARPIFGVGAGEFYQRSGEFSSPTLLELFPPARNENAHNNFLQILAELGAVGCASFLWLLILAARRGASAVRPARSLSAGASTAEAGGLAAGLCAFLLTCLAGHPLVIPEVAGTFWLALGVVTGLGWTARDDLEGASPHLEAGHRTRRRIVAAAAAVLALSVPIRARQQMADSNLEHVGIGLSGWHRTDDNLRYRIMAGSEGAVFVPAEAGSVTVPLRAAIAGQRLNVELRLDGRLANVVHAFDGEWTNTLVVLPPRSDGPRFRRLDLKVGDGPVAREMLLVGKVIPH